MSQSWSPQSPASLSSEATLIQPAPRPHRSDETVLYERVVVVVSHSFTKVVVQMVTIRTAVVFIFSLAGPFTAEVSSEAMAGLLVTISCQAASVSGSNPERELSTPFGGEEFKDAEVALMEGQ